MVLPEGSCGEDMGLSLVRRGHWWWSI
jgi:hypothetical protein